MAGQLADWDESHDGRAVFLGCYLRMTEAVVAAVDDGRFRDDEWVTELLDRFADHYFDSIDGGAESHRIPEPWVLAHAAAVGADAHPLQLLLAGVNAHINYDLVLTLFEVLQGEWIDHDDAQRTSRRADYEIINDIIAETADLVQDSVLAPRAPWLALADRALGRWDERAAVRLLSGWRTQVWRHASELLDEPDDRSRSRRVGRLERQCTRRATWLLL